MEKVHFIQFEIFEASKRVAQFGGSPADRKKLVRKARMMAQKVVDKLRKQNEDPWSFHRRFVSVREWNGTAFFETASDGHLILRGSTNANGSESLPINLYVKDLTEFFALHCDDCVRNVGMYYREYYV